MNAHADNRPLGIVLMLLAAFTLCAADAAGKWAMADGNVVQLNFIRGIVAVLILAPLSLREGGLRVFKTARPVAHALRCLLLVSLAYGWFLGIAQMPLADAAGIALCAPLCMMAMSAWFLGDKVDPTRWAAVIAGFVGMLLIIRPGTDVFTWAALLPAWAAVGYAAYMVSNRAMRQTESVTALTLYPQIAVLVASTLALPWFWQPIGFGTIVAMALVGVFAAGGHLLLTYAFRYAPPSVLAPLDYTGLIWEVAFGLLIFGDWPAPIVWTGLAVIVAAGLFVIYRETLAAKAALPANTAS
jgi:drug/metabolite transporter (DMT)-like permease